MKNKIFRIMIVMIFFSLIFMLLIVTKYTISCDLDRVCLDENLKPYAIAEGLLIGSFICAASLSYFWTIVKGLTNFINEGDF